MTTPGKVVGLAHQAVGTPRDGMRCRRLDGEAAAGADIPLDRRGCGDRLHVPPPVALLLESLTADERTAEVERGLVVSLSPARTIGPRH
jgi:hypothetical protein